MKLGYCKIQILWFNNFIIGPPSVRVMPQLPAFSSCSAPMRLVTVEPHPRYLNIDIHNYSCDCGHNEDFVVAHKD
jgi:hypothetical protein